MSCQRLRSVVMFAFDQWHVECGAEERVRGNEYSMEGLLAPSQFMLPRALLRTLRLSTMLRVLADGIRKRR